MLGGFIWGGAMLGGAIFFLREWRPRDGRSKGLFDSLASPLDSRSRPAMPDRIERGSPKSSSNSSAFMSILFAFYCAARFVEVGGWLCLVWKAGLWARTAGLRAAYDDGSVGRLRCAHRLARPEVIRPRGFPTGGSPVEAVGPFPRGTGLESSLGGGGGPARTAPIFFFSSALTPLACAFARLVFALPFVVVLLWDVTV